MKQADSRYQYGAAYVTKAQKEAYEKVLTQAPFSTVTTLVGDFLEDAVVAKEGGTMTLQSITSDGISHTYREDIRMKSLQTSLAYSNIVFDLKQILWPQQKEDRWEVLYEKDLTESYSLQRSHYSPSPKSFEFSGLPQIPSSF